VALPEMKLKNYDSDWEKYLDLRSPSEAAVILKTHFDSKAECFFGFNVEPSFVRALMQPCMGGVY